jgi:hypothetical protein
VGNRRGCGRAAAHVEPARLARVDLRGSITQYPSAPRCLVPDLVGLELALVPLIKASLDFGGQRSLDHCENVVRLGHVRRSDAGARRRRVVVAQTPRPGTPARGYIAVDVSLGLPSTPAGCRVPAPFHDLVQSKNLLVWREVTKMGEELRETYDGCVPPRGRPLTSVGPPSPRGADAWRAGPRRNLDPHGSRVDLRHIEAASSGAVCCRGPAARAAPPGCLCAPSRLRRRSCPQRQDQRQDQRPGRRRRSRAQCLNARAKASAMTP